MAPAAVEREHELCTGTLSERLTGDERLELGGHRRVPAEGELGVEAVLGADEAQLGQPCRLETRERLAELGQRLASPERERLPEQAGCGARVAGVQRRAARITEPLESEE